MRLFQKNYTFVNKGQATIEYILLLTVIIALFLSIGRPLGDRLSKFSGALIGKDGYYACLTKEGQLPGYEGCQAHLQGSTQSLSEFSGVAGSGGGFRISGSDQGSGLDSGSDSSGDTNLRSDSNQPDSEGSRLSRSSRHKLGKRARRNSKNSSRFATKGASSQGESLATLDSSFNSSELDQNKGRKKTKIPLKAKGEQIIGNQFKKSGNSKKNRTKIKIVRGEAYLGEQVYFLEEETKTQTVFQVKGEGVKSGIGSESEEKKQRLIEKRDPSGQLTDEKDREWNFGVFLKYLIIVILIIALLVIIFSQVMEYQARE